MPEFDPNSLEAVLARMESRQIVNTDRLGEIIARLDKHEQRISLLEHYKWKLAGALAVGSTGGGLAGAAVFSKLLGGE